MSLAIAWKWQLWGLGALSTQTKTIWICLYQNQVFEFNDKVITYYYYCHCISYVYNRKWIVLITSIIITLYHLNLNIHRKNICVHNPILWIYYYKCRFILYVNNFFLFWNLHGKKCSIIYLEVMTGREKNMNIDTTTNLLFHA